MGPVRRCYKTAVIPLIYLHFVTACARDAVYLSDFCLHADPIYPNGAAWDAADRETRQAIIAHNEKGVELGCWEAPKPKVSH